MAQQKKTVAQKLASKTKALTEEKQRSAKLLADIEAREADLETKTKEFEVRMIKASEHVSKSVEITEEGYSQAPPIFISELGQGTGIERLTEQELMAQKETIVREAFMNDMLLVMVHPSELDEAIELPSVAVNGMSQYFIRGRDQWVKRKYVEQLARSTIETFTQDTPDASRPEAIRTIPKKGPKFPFTVKEDPHPDGAVWLANIQKQP